MNKQIFINLFCLYGITGQLSIISRGETKLFLTKASLTFLTTLWQERY